MIPKSKWISAQVCLPYRAPNDWDTEWIVTDCFETWVTDTHPGRWNKPPQKCTCGYEYPSPRVEYWMPCETPGGLPLPPHPYMTLMELTR